MGKVVTLSSGAELEMTMASFEEGKALLKAVTQELKHINVSQEKGDTFNILKELFASAILSPQIEVALKPCLDKCLYKKVKLSNNIFEDETVRGDYFPIIKEVLEYNLTPFFASLTSLLKDLGGRLKSAPKLS